MKIHYNHTFKTLGPQAAKLVSELYERGRPMFSLADALRILGTKPDSARRLVTKLVARGIAARLKPGLFILVPFELGRARTYMPNPCVVARELAGDRKYYLSHASAMDIHQMVTQPQLIVYATVLRPARSRTVLGTEFRFVLSHPGHFFGLTEHWVEKHQKVWVSDLERTILDGLKQPEYCGGISEVAKGLWIRRAEVSPVKLVDYALRLDVGAVVRRLGFLMELFQIQAPTQIEPLHRTLTSTYVVLDPILPHEGKYLKRWRLRLNITSEELLAVTRA